LSLPIGLLINNLLRILTLIYPPSTLQTIAPYCQRGEPTKKREAGEQTPSKCLALGSDACGEGKKAPGEERPDTAACCG